MFSIKSEHQSSYLSNKKEQMRKEVRREKLDSFFASKRRQLFQITQSQLQNENYLQNFAKTLDRLFIAESELEAQAVIKDIFDQLTQDNVKFEAAILQQPEKLIKLFILFPKNRHTVQILRMFIEYCYDQTFGLDDKKFTFKHNQNSFEVQIEPKQMTEYQQAIDILMKTIHELIPELQHRKRPQYCSTHQEMAEANETNKRISKRLKMYLTCLANISLRINSFIMRYEYVEKYLSVWSKWLLVDYDFGKYQILSYINLAARFSIPYRSLSKHSNNSISQEQFEAEQNIVLRLFQLCVPQGDRVDDEKYDIFALLIIEPLFSYIELRIDVLIKFVDQIMRLLSVVLWRRDRFKMNNVQKMFKLVAKIINRLILETNNENLTQEDRHLIRSVNMVEIIKNMEFLQTMSFYLMSERWALQDMFLILHALIEYCIVFDIDIEEVIGYKEIFIEICHKISNEDRVIMQTNLKSLGMICRYAQVKNINRIFAQMVYNGVVDTLENLAYALLDEFSGQEARELLEIYFTDEQVERYLGIDEQSKNNKLEVEIPDRHEYYDY